MTICNMSIEAGAKAGMIAPDDTTFAYHRRAQATRQRACSGSRRSMIGARCPRTTARNSIDEVVLDGAAIRPHVSWGTNPGQVVSIDGRVPDPASIADPGQREMPPQRALRVHGSEARNAGARDRRSIRSSSAPARIAGSRICDLAASIVARRQGPSGDAGNGRARLDAGEGAGRSGRA